MKEQPNYYSILIAEVRYDTTLSSSEKLFYSEITALATKEGYCWASSTYFEELYGVSRQSIYNWSKKLSDKGYISIEIIKDEKGKVIGRKLYPKMTKGDVKKTLRGDVKKTLRGDVKKTLRKHTSSNKTSKEHTADAGGGNNSPHNFTLPEEQSKEQQAAIEVGWLELQATYKPAGDRGMLNKKLLEDQKKIYSTFSTEERTKILEWFKKYSKQLEDNKVWFSNFFKDKKTIGEVAEFFRKLKDLAAASDAKAKKHNIHYNTGHNISENFRSFIEKNKENITRIE